MKKIILSLCLLAGHLMPGQTLIKLKQLERSATAGSVIIAGPSGIPQYTTTDGTLWKTTGNAVATSTNFIGTTTNQTLSIRTNNILTAQFEPAGSLSLFGQSGTTFLNISAPAGQFPAISLQEAGAQNWAIYNNTGVAGKPLVFFDNSSGANVMTLTGGELAVTNATTTNCFKAINLGTAATQFPQIALTGVTYEAKLFVGNANHATLPNSAGYYTNALNGFNVNDGTTKYLSVSTTTTGQNFLLNRTTIGSTVTPSATLQVIGTVSVSSTATVSGNVIINTAGNGLQITEGANARLGTATLVAGSATVANTGITATSRVFLQGDDTGASATWGELGVTKNAGANFIITSANVADTRVISYFIVEGK